MRRIFVAVLVVFSLSSALQARTFYVAFNGRDANAGTDGAPFRTIQHAANVAQAGDTITVHEGIYRERIDPPRGGTSATTRIVYQAAPGEKPVITGSEPVKNWVKVQENVWKAAIPNSFFGNFNPYSDLIHGDWFNPLGREHHTGAVYLHGYWLAEAAGLDDVMKPMGEVGLWFAKVDAKDTTIWAQFNGIDPNQAPVEINVRQTVFYPRKTGVNYITVRGFTLENAATNWAPPTAEQVGVIGPHWSKGWIIERNLVRNSVCSGISLGKYGDEFDNTSANSAEGYVKTIDRALANGWTKENIGHHIVRNNTITDCGQGGDRWQHGSGVQHGYGQYDSRHSYAADRLRARRWRGSSFMGRLMWRLRTTASIGHAVDCGLTGWRRGRRFRRICSIKMTRMFLSKWIMGRSYLRTTCCCRRCRLWTTRRRSVCA